MWFLKLKLLFLETYYIEDFQYEKIIDGIPAHCKLRMESVSIRGGFSSTYDADDVGQ